MTIKARIVVRRVDWDEHYGYFLSLIPGQDIPSKRYELLDNYQIGLIDGGDSFPTILSRFDDWNRSRVERGMPQIEIVF